MPLLLQEVEENVWEFALDKKAVELTETRHGSILKDLKQLKNQYKDLVQYLYVYMIRNGYVPNDAVKSFVSKQGDIEWTDSYLSSVCSLRDLSCRILRTHLIHSGNIIYGVNKLDLPKRLKDIVLFTELWYPDGRSPDYIESVVCEVEP
jgi:hypothetical protein